MSVPTALTIAGSDPSGGAGIQADLKTFSALGAFGTTVITALTAQNTRGVTGVHAVPVNFIRAQYETLVEDVRIDSIKIGMLANAAVTDEVTSLITSYQKRRLDAGERRAWVVLDPVMVATSGDRLLDSEGMEALLALMRVCDVITPNLPEAAALLDTAELTDVSGLEAQAAALLALGARAVVLKGGHLARGPVIDVFADGDGTTRFEGERVDTRNTHGTGCTLSSALAALRPARPDWRSTMADAKEWLTDALRAADSLEIGHGHGPVHHFHRWWPTGSEV